MKRFYSKSTGLCYLPGIHTSMPSDAVEIDDKTFTSVIGNTPPGKVRDHDEDGLPFLVDAPPPTPEVLYGLEQAWRNKVLLSTDSLVVRHRDQVEAGIPTTLTDEQYKALQAYRQELRDWPESPAFPDITARPEGGLNSIRRA